MGNKSSTLSRSIGEGEDTAPTNKRKRDDSDGTELRASKQVFIQHQQPAGIVAPSDSNILPTFSTMPETVLLHVFSFVLAPQKGMFSGRSNVTLSVQLALEQTCRRFSSLLGKDSTMRLLYKGQPKVEFEYQVEGEREKMFLQRGIGMIRHFQKQTDTLICGYMGGADGVRTIIDKMLVKMEVPRSDTVPYIAHQTMIGPPLFPPNGFKLFLRGDSIAYLTELVEQHMVSRLTSALRAALFRSDPPSRHSYPTVRPSDLFFVDKIRESDFGKQLYIHINEHRRLQSCNRLSAGDANRIWKWHTGCLVEDIIGADQRQRMVRAIASRAGIVKLSGGAFDCISKEILHSMAIIVVHVFEASKSLWFHDENIGVYDDFHAGINDTIDEEDDDGSRSSEQSNDYEVDYSKVPPPPPKTLDEEGKQLCVIIPRQIKDAAARIGMKPLLDSQSWQAGEGRSRHEEVEEARLMYYTSSSEDDSSDEDCDDDAKDFGQVTVAACLEDNIGEDADSNGDLDNHASEVEEDEANMSAGEVVDAGAIENLLPQANEEIVGANIDENDLDSCSSSLSY